MIILAVKGKNRLSKGLYQNVMMELLRGSWILD